MDFVRKLCFSGSANNPNHSQLLGFRREWGAGIGSKQDCVSRVPWLLGAGLASEYECECFLGTRMRRASPVGLKYK
jgi:hypothetical protein